MKFPVFSHTARHLARPALFLSAVGLLFSCGPSGKKNTDTLDNANSGRITIAVDGSVEPIIAAELDAFAAGYPKAHITPIYTSEGEAMRLLLADSVRLAVILREPNAYETAELAKQQLKVRSLRVASDAVALITNLINPDSLFTVSEVNGLLSGTITTYKALGKNNNPDSVTTVFDRSNGGNLDYMQQRLGLKNEDLKGKIFSVNSNTEVIEYVKTHKNALGFIGVNWISDLDTPEHRAFSESVRVAGIADTLNPGPDDYYQPYQAYLSLKKYPFRREVYIVSREARFGLGSGFSAYMASDIGQRIILKAGLLPATAPVRLVNFGKKK